MFTDFKERNEKVEAFQYTGYTDSGESVLEAFGANPENWTVRSVDGKVSISFPKPKKKEEKPAPATSADGFCTLTIQAIGSPVVDSSQITVNEGDWVLRRYVDTDHPETVVMTDKAFSRKYRRA